MSQLFYFKPVKPDADFISDNIPKNQVMRPADGDQALS